MTPLDTRQRSEISKKQKSNVRYQKSESDVRNRDAFLRISRARNLFV